MPPLVLDAIAAFILLNAVIGMVTYVTLLERKFAARMQSRIGPYRVGPHGLLQPIADALKLLLDEIRTRLHAAEDYELPPLEGERTNPGVSLDEAEAEK